MLGGAAVTEEIFPGFRFSRRQLRRVSLLRPEIIRELELPQHGLDILPLDGTFTPAPPGDGAGAGRRRLPVAGQRPRPDDPRAAALVDVDAEAYEEYGQLMVEMARFIKPILAIVPPDPTGLDPRPFLPLGRARPAFQQLPERQQAVFVQLMTMSAADFLGQWFETDPLKATMSASGIIGTFQGIRRPGTAYVLLHHYMGEIDGAFRAWGIPKGGTGGVSKAIALGGPGARRGDPDGGAGRADQGPWRPARPASSSNPARRSGADVVLSSVDVRRTFLGLLEPGTLDPEFEAEVRRFKFRGSPARSTWRSTALPDFTCLPGAGEHLRGAISFSPSVDYMERAYDDAKYGRLEPRPYIDMIIPTLVDPSMAPPGKHVISCFVQYAPYDLDPSSGAWDDQREAFGDTVIDRIAEFAPNIRDIIVGRQVLTPLDIERTFGLTEGNIFQGELRSSSCSSAGRSRATRGSGRRSATSGCAARRPTRAAGSWAPPAASPRWRCSRAARPAGGLRWRRPTRRRRLRRDRRRRGPQRARLRRLPRAGPACGSSSSSARDRVGGAAETTELAPGVRVPTLAHTVGRLRPSVVRELGLRDHGLTLVAPDVRVFAPQPDGRR